MVELSEFFENLVRLVILVKPLTLLHRIKINMYKQWLLFKLFNNDDFQFGSKINDGFQFIFVEELSKVAVAWWMIGKQSRCIYYLIAWAWCNNQSQENLRFKFFDRLIEVDRVGPAEWCKKLIFVRFRIFFWLYYYCVELVDTYS